MPSFQLLYPTIFSLRFPWLFGGNCETAVVAPGHSDVGQGNEVSSWQVISSHGKQRLLGSVVQKSGYITSWGKGSLSHYLPRVFCTSKRSFHIFCYVHSDPCNNDPICRLRILVETFPLLVGVWIKPPNVVMMEVGYLPFFFKMPL